MRVVPDVMSKALSLQRVRPARDRRAYCRTFYKKMGVLIYRRRLLPPPNMLRNMISVPQRFEEGLEGRGCSRIG